MHILPLHTFLVAMRCYYLQPASILAGCFWLFLLGLFAIRNPAQHVNNFCHTLFSETHQSWITQNTSPPSLSLPIKTVCAHTELGSCTDVGRIPNFILILSACQFWKGEAGQKIIGRTSHKCECGEQQMWVVEVEGWGLPLGLPKARPTIVQRRSHFCGCYNNHNTLSMSLRSR